jgi:putative membrane protein
MNVPKLATVGWAPVLVLLAAAACRNDNLQGSGSAPTPAVPSTDAVQDGKPANGTGTPPSATATSATNSPASSDTSAHQGGTASGLNHTPPAELAAPLSDGQIAAITDGLNSGEIEQAKVAKSKSKNKDVLAFANMMIEHHGQAKKQQAALKETPETSPLSTQLQGEAQQTLTKLQQANGADFDRAYLEAQVDGHQKALDTLKSKLLPSAKTPELTKYLRELQPKIEQHLARARTLRDATVQAAPTGTREMTKPASMRQGTTSASPSTPSGNH